VEHQKEDPVSSWTTPPSPLKHRRKIIVDQDRQRQYRSEGLKHVEIPNIPMFRHGTPAWLAASLIMQGNPYVTGADAAALMAQANIEEVKGMANGIHKLSTNAVKPFFAKVVKTGGKRSTEVEIGGKKLRSVQLANFAGYHMDTNRLWEELLHRNIVSA
jgi:hypothetical protein